MSTPFDSTQNPDAAAAAQQAEYLQSIVDTVREPLVVLARDLRVVSANRAFYQTFRVSEKGTLGRLVYDLGNGQWNIAALRTLLEEVLPRDSHFDDFEVRHDFPGLGSKKMLLNARKLFRPGDRSEMLLLAIEDVTERRRTQNTLQQTEERLRLLVDGARDHAILMLDPDGRIIEWNTGAERIIGWREDEVLGQRVHLIFTPEDRATGVPEQEMSSSRRDGRAEDARWHLRKDGTRFWADGVMTGLRDEAGALRGFGKVIRDATARKASEDALQTAYERERRIADMLQRPLTMTIAENAFPGMEVVTLYEAALDEAAVGGDFFDAFTLPGNRIALAVADASGKGLAAAARTIQLKEVLRAFARETPCGAGELVSRLNEYVCDARHFDESGEEGFVALSLCLLDPQTGEATLVSAGMEPPLIVRADGTTKEMDVSGMPLGIEPGERYETTTLHLAQGDTLILLSDGLTEARAPSGAFLGCEGITALAQRCLQGEVAASSLRHAADALLEGARAFAGGVLHDDACLLLARRA